MENRNVSEGNRNQFTLLNLVLFILFTNACLGWASARYKYEMAFEAGRQAERREMSNSREMDGYIRTVFTLIDEVKKIQEKTTNAKTSGSNK